MGNSVTDDTGHKPVPAVQNAVTLMRRLAAHGRPMGATQIARETGTASDRGQLYRGLDIAASLACDAKGSPRLGMSSITIAGQKTDEDLDRVASALAEAARQIERCLFGRQAGTPA